MRDTLQFVLAGADVVRYHTVHTLVRETVGHHSHGVALLAYLLDPSLRAEVLLYALVHDLAEHQTGDIPAPAKREYGIGDQVNELEERLLRGVGLGFEVTKSEARTLKLADIAQGALFCVREIGLGNSKMSVVYDRYISYAEAFVLVGEERELFNIIKEMRNEHGW